MKRYVVVLLILCGQQANAEPQKASVEAIEWAKEQLKRNLLQKIPPSILSHEKMDALSKGKCSSPSLKPDVNYPVVVFLSFTVPETTWINLSKELEKCGGAIVLRGLPKNSFRLLSLTLQGLMKKGVNSPILINPQLFKKYEVKTVPTIVFVDDEKFDKVSGNISLSYAVEHAAQHGETETAFKLFKTGSK